MIKNFLALVSDDDGALFLESLSTTFTTFKPQVLLMRCSCVTVLSNLTRHSPENFFCTQSVQLISFVQLSLSMFVSSKINLSMCGSSFSHSIFVKLRRQSGSTQLTAVFLSIGPVVVVVVVVVGLNFKISSPGRIILSVIFAHPWFVAQYIYNHDRFEINF